MSNTTFSYNESIYLHFALCTALDVLKSAPDDTIDKDDMEILENLRKKLVEAIF